MTDLSNRAIFVLVILTVVISVFSAVLLLTVKANISPAQAMEISESHSSTTGMIKFSVEKPKTAISTGKIGYSISKQS